MLSAAGSLLPFEKKLDEAIVHAYDFFKQKGDCESIEELMQHVQGAPEGSLPNSVAFIAGASEWMKDYQRSQATAEVEAAIAFFIAADAEKATSALLAPHRAAILRGKSMELERGLMTRVLAPLALYIMQIMATNLWKLDTEELGHLLTLLESLTEELCCVMIELQLCHTPNHSNNPM